MSLGKHEFGESSQRTAFSVGMYCLTPKPEATSRHAGLVRGKCLHEQVRIFDMHPLTGPEHLECRIEAKKRLQEVLLIPESMPIKHPLLRIFQGQKDVVHVHNDSWPNARQNLQKQKFHVATDFAHVRGINEQNIVFAERLKLAERNLLNRYPPKLEAGWKRRFQLRRCIRINGNEPARTSIHAVAT